MRLLATLLANGIREGREGGSCGAAARTMWVSSEAEAGRLSSVCSRPALWRAALVLPALPLSENLTRALPAAVPRDLLLTRLVMLGCEVRL